ncbi:cellobiose transport system permease protein [Nocardioides marinisabuli]|uniref:Cellobiose transport system permease protein n=1 Tax=Nocardioides marinisabuli TaxID=419476 RepID=A0A7Y9F2J8_9ACTN|nr:sugar ABC transporter permease [Nocardioides marinisabuli]NYD58196.1 cellobiose transport system permease protein [Nocardioides marinisabuli]
MTTLQRDSRTGGPVQGPPARGRAGSRLLSAERRSRWDVKFSPYLYISPFFVLFAVVGVFPLLYTAYVSVHDWDLLGGQGAFVGLDNFARVLEDRYFWNALRNTLSIFLLSSVPQILIAIWLAFLLDTHLRARTFWRMSILVPFVVAPVAVSLIFGNLFGDRYGLVNEILQVVGLDAVRWHVDTLPSHLAIATMVNWRWTGYNALIFLAAMQAIPRDVYEAADIDGASKFRQFLHITVPMLRPTIIFIVITSTIGGLQIFAEPRLFDNAGLGGSDRQYQTVTMYLWELGWRVRDLGTAASVAWLLFLIIIVFALVNLVLTLRIATSGGPR